MSRRRILVHNLFERAAKGDNRAADILLRYDLAARPSGDEAPPARMEEPDDQAILRDYIASLAEGRASYDPPIIGGRGLRGGSHGFQCVRPKGVWDAKSRRAVRTRLACRGDDPCDFRGVGRRYAAAPNHNSASAPQVYLRRGRISRLGDRTQSLAAVPSDFLRLRPGDQARAGFSVGDGAPWYRHAFPNVGKFVRNTETELITAHNGGRRALSLGGSVTGFGADFIIIDDLMKAADAAYPIERQRVKDAYQATIIPRLEDKRVGKVIVIQQRLHEDDLAGFLIESGQFKHLNLPAIAEDDGEFHLGRGRVHHRRKGEALSTREPLEALEVLRLEMGSSAFAAQYQQNPTAQDGAVVRWERFVTYDEAPPRSACQMIVQSWDTGIKINSTSSFSVCTTWGLHAGVWLLLDLVRVRLEFSSCWDWCERFEMTGQATSSSSRRPPRVISCCRR